MKNVLLLHHIVKQASLLQYKQRGFHISKLLLASKVINVPSMGDSISEGTLVEIRKAVGSSVQVDDVIAILDTDKVSVDVSTPVAGKVTEFFANLEDNVIVGKPLFSIDESDAPSSSSSSSSSPSTSTPAPSPVKETNNNSSPVSTKTEVKSSGHRIPLIKFIGKRTGKPTPEAKPTTTTSPTTVAINNIESLRLIKRIPISLNEIKAINSGIAML